MFFEKSPVFARFFVFLATKIFGKNENFTAFKL